MAKTVLCPQCEQRWVLTDDPVYDARGRMVCDTCWALGGMRLAAWKVLAWTAGICVLLVLGVALFGS